MDRWRIKNCHLNEKNTLGVTSHRLQPSCTVNFPAMPKGILPNESLKETVIWIYSKEAYTALYFTVVIFSSMKPVIWAFNSLSWGVGPESKRICQLETAVRAEWSWMSKQDKYSSLFMSLFAYSYAAYIVNRDLEDWNFLCVFCSFINTEKPKYLDSWTLKKSVIQNFLLMFFSLFLTLKRINMIM